MKLINVVMMIILLAGQLYFDLMPSFIYAAGIDKNNTAITGNESRIDQERDAIIEDRRKMQEAYKTGDKAKIEQARKEILPDISRRQAVIKDLHWEIAGKNGNIKDAASAKSKKKKWDR